MASNQIGFLQRRSTAENSKLYLVPSLPLFASAENLTPNVR